MRRYLNRFPNFLLTGIISLALLIGCGSGGGGGGGGGGGSNKSINATIEKIYISGSVITPGGVNPSSLKIVNFGETAPITTQGNFTAEVYSDGVSVIAAMPDDKEFGLMNVVAAYPNITSSSKSTDRLLKVVAAYKTAADTTAVELSAKTTAVSMVFVTPYFLTNDPEKAAELLNFIENDPKVADLADAVENSFNDPDPLSNPILQQYLKEAIQSVLDTVSSRTMKAGTVNRAITSSHHKTLQIPKRTSEKALAMSVPPYYADQGYITLKAEPTSSGYDLSISSKFGGSVDWIAQVMQLDPLQFASLSDFQAKAHDNRSLYADEGTKMLGELEAPARSIFRYIDVIAAPFELAYSLVFKNSLRDRETVPSDKDGIYLVRAYSGGWGKLIDPDEESFVIEKVINGSYMDRKTLAVNAFMVVFDTVSAFIPFDKLLPDDMNKIAKIGITEAYDKLPSVKGNPEPNLRDLLRISTQISKAVLSEVVKSYTKQQTKNFFKMIWLIGEVSVSSAIDFTGKASDVGKAVDRFIQMLTLTTPLESIIVVVGDPFATFVDIEKPSTPTELNATAVSATQINLFWTQSTDNVGTIEYKIYREGVQLGTSMTHSYSDTSLSPSTNYCYSVSAYDVAGNESDKSSISCSTTLTIPTTWPKTFGGVNDDYGYSVQQTSDGGYIIAGTTDLYGVGLTDAYLIKTNANGSKVWEKTFGAANNDSGYSVQQTSDGGFIMAGTTESYGAGGSDVYLIKTDASGNKVWEKAFGGLNNDSGASVQQTSDGGYIITGMYGYSFSDHDVYLMKTDANGNKLWEKIFGSISDDTGMSVQQTADGGYIVAGVKDATFDFNNSNSDFSLLISEGDVYLIKTDTNGNKLWEKTFGTWGGGEVGLSIQKTLDGGYIISGWTVSDVYLIKTDAYGNISWEKTFGGSNRDYGDSVQQTSDGGYIIAGLTESYGTGGRDVYLIKTDGNGNKEWEKTFGGTSDERGLSVRQTSDGGYIIAGYTMSYGAGGRDVYLIKTDSSGNAQMQLQ